MKFIDLSHTIRHGMPVFPGEESPSVVRDELPEDAGYVTHRLETNMHTGTHIDAPFHMLGDERPIASFPPELFAGQAIVMDVRGLSQVSIQPGWEESFRKYKVVLFYTGHSQAWGTYKYYHEYPEFDVSIAEMLVACGVKIAGFDSPSPDKSPYGFHTVFLKEARFLVENLAHLDRLGGEENILFMAFPLKIEAEASLVRAVAMTD